VTIVSVDPRQDLAGQDDRLVVPVQVIARVDSVAIEHLYQDHYATCSGTRSA
jgi:hypothetical protein